MIFPKASSLFIVICLVSVLGCGKKKSTNDAPDNSADVVVDPPIPTPPVTKTCLDHQKADIYKKLALKKDATVSDMVDGISKNYRKQDFWKSVKTCN